MPFKPRVNSVCGNLLDSFAAYHEEKTKRGRGWCIEEWKRTNLKIPMHRMPAKACIPCLVRTFSS